MKIHFKSIAVFVFLLFLTACSGKKNEEDLFLQGAFLNQLYYSPSSFFNEEIARKVLDVNHLDFLAFALHYSSAEKEIDAYSDNIKSIERAFRSSKDRAFLEYPLIHDDLYRFRPAEDPSVYFNDKQDAFKKTPEPTQSQRQSNINLFYNLFTIRRNGTVQNYYDEYLNILDRGYQASPVATAYILGTDWQIQNPLRIYLISKSRKPEKIRENFEKRRFYLSQEKNVEVRFFIEDEPVGSVLNIRKPSLNYFISIRSPQARVSRIELLTQHRRVYQTYDGMMSREVIRSGTINNENSFSYYFLRIEFSNGNIALTSPIWVYNERKFLINNFVQKPMNDPSGKSGINYSFDVNNITSSPLNNVQVQIVDSKGATVAKSVYQINPFETKTVASNYTFDNSSDEILDIRVKQSDYQLHYPMKVNKSLKSRKVLIDASHSNIFREDMAKLIQFLKENNYEVTIESSRKLVEDIEYLKKFKTVIFNIPDSFFKENQEEESLKFIYTLQKYIYNDGNLILGNYYDDHTRFNASYINEFLQFIGSPVRIRVNAENNIYQVVDKFNNYQKNQGLPVFADFNKDVLVNEGVSRICFRNPLEIYGQNGTIELPLAKFWNITPLVFYGPSTSILENKKDNTNNCIAVLQSYGEGQIAILGGINYSDNDLDSLDNKKWVLQLFNYLSN